MVRRAAGGSSPGCGAGPGAGGAIDLSAGGASGHRGGGGSLDALASSLPGGTGGAGAAGLAAGGGSFDGLVRGGGRKGRRGGARVGGRLSGGKGMSVRGSLARSKVRKTVSRHYSKLRRCYLNRLQTRPGLQGRIVVHFVIGSSGRVERVSSFDSIGDGALKRCVENRFRMMRFDKPKRGVVHVNWPLTFRAG